MSTLKSVERGEEGVRSFYSTTLEEDKIYLEMCPAGLELLLTPHLLPLIFEIKAEFLNTNYEDTFLKK